MPIYDLFCTGCGHEETDVIMKYKDTNMLCPMCKEEMTRKTPLINFKIKDPALTKHLRKWGNDSLNVPTANDNGVRFGRRKRRT